MGAQVDVRPITTTGELTDQAVAGYIAKYATKAAECVGRAAIYAMSYSPSVPFKPLLGQLAAHDPDPAVRQDASLMLEIFSEVGTGEA
jgi:hypothetical protein